MAVDLRVLADYISKQLEKGYDINTIRNYLVHYGYNPIDVNQAVNMLHQQPQQPVQPVPLPTHFDIHSLLTSKKFILVSSLLLVFIVLGSVSLFFVLKPPAQFPSKLLDLEITALKHSVQAGANLEFNIELFSIGSQKRYDITLLHEVFDSDNNRITYKEETPGIETRLSKKSSIPIPTDVDVGRYVLRTTATYDSSTSTAEVPFTIIKPSDTPTCTDGLKNQGEEAADCGGPCDPCPSCDDGLKNGNELGVDCDGDCEPCMECPDSCDDGNECTKDICSEETDFACQFIPITPCCGNNKCEVGEDVNICSDDCEDEEPLPSDMSPSEILDSIESIASKNPDKAGKLCDSIDDKSGANKCFDKIAVATKKPIFCDYISTESTKDSCFMRNFALKGNFEVCDDVKDNYLKDTCNTLKQLNKDNPNLELVDMLESDFQNVELPETSEQKEDVIIEEEPVQEGSGADATRKWLEDD